jgi:hypothetical protein
MSKFTNFIKKLLSNIKDEIVMEQPADEPKNFKKVHVTRENTKFNKVKKHLIEKGSIDSWTAINLYGATRLSDIIFRLRNKGYNIDSIDNSAYDRNKELCNFTTYKYINNNGIN